MSKLFYDHLIVIEEVSLVLDSVSDLSSEEKKELLSHVDRALHHEIMDEILTHLPHEHHQEFLTKFSEAPFDGTLIHYIVEKSGKDIEKHILTRANKVKKKFIQHIQK